VCIESTEIWWGNLLEYPRFEDGSRQKANVTMYLREKNFGSTDVDETGSGTCTMAVFGIHRVGTSDSATRAFVTHSVRYSLHRNAIHTVNSKYVTMKRNNFVLIKYRLQFLSYFSLNILKRGLLL